MRQVVHDFVGRQAERLHLLEKRDDLGEVFLALVEGAHDAHHLDQLRLISRQVLGGQGLPVLLDPWRVLFRNLHRNVAARAFTSWPIIIRYLMPLLLLVHLQKRFEGLGFRV